MHRTLPLLAVLLAAHPLSAQNVGPDAPDFSVSYDAGFQDFFFLVSDPATSNNYQQGYVEEILPAEASPDPYWRFQGYLLFQFVNSEAAEGDLLHNIHDPALARPVLGLDRNDGITDLMESFHFSDAQPCMHREWVFADSGLNNGFAAVMDPFTNAPYVEGNTYCFLVVAVGANIYHEDDACGQEDQIIFSSRSATGGPLMPQCVLAGTVGVAEVPGTADGFTAFPNPAHGVVQVRFSGDAARSLQVIDAQGRLCRTQAVRSGDAVDTAQLSPGVYRMVLTDGVGRRSARTIAVE